MVQVAWCSSVKSVLHMYNTVGVTYCNIVQHCTQVLQAQVKLLKHAAEHGNLRWLGYLSSTGGHGAAAMYAAPWDARACCVAKADGVQPATCCVCLHIGVACRCVR